MASKKPPKGNPNQVLTDYELDLIALALDAAILKAVNRIEQLLVQTTEGINAMGVDLTALAAEVSSNTDVVNSAEQVLQSLIDELAASSGDQAAVDALTQQLSDAKTSLANAIAAATPAAPATGTPPDTSTTAT